MPAYLIFRNRRPLTLDKDGTIDLNEAELAASAYFVSLDMDDGSLI
jgi:hypothetical protein